MQNITIYHNPRCSKSREALALLQERNLSIQIVEYLKNPPSSATIKKILKLLKLKPRDIMRKQEEIYRTHQLDNQNLSDEALITSIVENPILMERPIVIVDEKAVIARPPQKLLEIL